MTTETKATSAQPAGVHPGTQTYQESMQGLSAVVVAMPTESGVVILRPGQLSTVQVQAGKHYKLRKSANTDQTPDDLVAVRHGDALHVRYADGSIVNFENFYSVCTDARVCSVTLASDGAAGITLSAESVNAGVVADDGLLVYAHGDTQVLMAMAQDQPGLSGALLGVDGGPTLTYMAPNPHVGLGFLGLAAIGALASGAGNSTGAALSGEPTNAGQVRALNTISDAAEKNTAIGKAITGVDNALIRISNAAGANNASGSGIIAGLVIDDYIKAGVSGVTSSNLASINKALDSLPVTADKADTTPEVQAIVNAYAAILASADSVTLQHSGLNNLAHYVYHIQGAIGVDSLNLQQTQDYLNTHALASGGLSTNSIFGTVADADHNAALKGWVITSAASDASGQHWQYSTDSGATWVNMDAASASQAIYLSTTDLVRWTGVKGANTELDAKAVDDTGPALHAANAAATLVDASVSGGSTAFSGNTAVLAANAAPLVFDLNHDGHIDYSHITMVMDGHQVDTAWAGANESILLWNKFGDAQLHDSSQYVFGQTTGSDLSGLAQLVDANHDGVFNAKDAQFTQFGLWQDANQNGVVDAGEFHALSDLGIASLSLKGDGVTSTPASGVAVNGHTTATLTDGSSMLVADATFSYVNSVTDSSLNAAVYHQPMVYPAQVL